MHTRSALLVATFGVVLLLGSLSQTRADAFVDGLAAYDAGDYASAAQTWTVLADSGDADAQVALAGLYRDGLGVDADSARAVELYVSAALLGSTDARRILGDFYARGLLVERDPVEAYALLGLAAAAGNAWSSRRQNDVAATMSAAQIRLAHVRLRELESK